MKEMMEERIQYLFQQYLNSRASREEEMELFEWALTPSNQEGVNSLLQNYWQGVTAEDDMTEEKAISMLQSILSNEQDTAAPVPLHSPQQPVHRTHFLKLAWVRYAAAIIILLGAGTFFYLQSDKKDKPVTVVQSEKDVLPAGNKAALKLADGSIITLDSTGEGKLAQQPGAHIIKSGNGEIMYSFDKGTLSGKVNYNSMSTPRGGQYKLVLPDGTRVWLNAETSISFPTAFVDDTREVQVTGEAYFEVAIDRNKPFVVKTPEESITVLGTSFNVYAYASEPVKTSLLEGSVKVGKDILKPGQASSEGKVFVTNLDQDIAWKNGRFDFNDLSAKQAILQLARWYNVEFKIESDISDVKFGGGLKRNLTLTQILRGLEGIGGLHFTLEGNTVTIRK